MRRLPGPMAPLVGLVALAGGGCSRGSAKATAVERPEAAVTSSASSATSAKVPVSLRASPAVFSAPIAALRTNHQIVVAGLIASEGVVRVMALTEAQPAWEVDAVRGVAWVPDAELRLQHAADGMALVWHGILGGKSGATLVILGPSGDPRGEAVPVGAGWCTTADGVAWLDPRGSGPVHLRSRAWNLPDTHDVATLPADRAPTLLCGDHDAFLLGEGDDDLTAVAFSPADGVARSPFMAIRDKDFGDDDEREHEAFTVGDDLGIVRVGGAGTVYLRQVSHGHASPWHRLKHALSEDDDIVAVDGDAASTFVVFTREAPDPCAGSESGALTVRAMRIDRQTGDEATVSLASGDCNSTPGPFWVEDAAGASVVGWSRRRARPAPDAAPIDGLVYRVFQGDRPREGRVDVEADALVEGGCDEAGCFGAALVRGPDNDGARPEAILALAYPQ
jgi:hypothetical protein